jgi:hypothetical protein
MKRQSTTIMILFLVVFALVVPVVVTGQRGGRGRGHRHTHKPTATSTPGVGWPDLTTIKEGANKTCGIDGAAQHGTEKAKLNDLKNRFTLPNGDFTPITFDELTALPQGQIQGTNIVGFPGSSDPNNARAVILEGYIAQVSTGGCSFGESCNCGTKDSNFCDTHINVFPDKASVNAAGHNMYVVEVTQRTRLLAAQNLLSSNVGNDWSTSALKLKLEGHKVRFSGYLYFDTDHSAETWAGDPQDKAGKPNWRQTAWEVHPVLKIEVLQ